METTFGRLFLLFAALAVAGCGGGSGAGTGNEAADDAGAGTLPPVPFSEDLVDNQALYSHPGTDLLDVYVTIWPQDNPESEEDTDCPFVNNADGIGTTLADVHQDLDKNDDCKPEVNIVLQMDGLIDSLGAANAELRMRGATSRLAGQKSYRVKLDSKEDAELWRGQRTLQFLKQPFDLTRLRNKLCFDLFIDIPHITSLRTQFARLWVDQKDGAGFVDFGLYTIVEKVNGRFLRSHGLDPDATVYKAEFFEFHRYADRLKLESDPTFDKDAFETRLEIEEGDDHAPLLAMLDAVNDDGNDFAQVFSTYFNEDNYLTWLACNILLNNLDTNSQNFFLYRHSASPKFYFLPWDYDASLDFWGQPVDQVFNGVSRAEEGLANWWGVKVHSRYFMQPGAVAKLTAKMQEIKNVYMTEARVQQLMDSYLPTARPQVSQIPDIWYLPALDTSSHAATMVEWDAEVARIPAMIEDNFQEYVQALDRPMPVYLDTYFDAGQVVFDWDAAHDLQGDGVTYDFQLSTTPVFDPGDIVAESLGLTDLTFEIPVAALASGDYFFRIIIRDTDDPVNNWQLAFDTYYDALGIRYHGMLKFTIP